MIFTNQLFIFFSLQILRNCASRPASPPSQPHSSVLRPHFHPHPLQSQPAVNLLYKALLDFVTLLLDFVTTEGALAVVAVQSVSIIYALLCKANALVCIQMFCFTLLCFTLLCLFFLHSGKFQLLWVRNPEAQRSTLFWGVQLLMCSMCNKTFQFKIMQQYLYLCARVVFGLARPFWCRF